VAQRGKHLVFADQGTPPDSNGESHNWAAAFGTDLTPTDSETGTNFRGPQGDTRDLPGFGSERAHPAGVLR
jgi:hypothetical protein